MSQDIAIIGIGLHPFGRHEGVSALQMGVQAANLALEDAGVAWKEIQFACAGSLEVTQPDSIVKFLGLTGIPFTSIFNGCATGGSLLLNASHCIQAGSGDLGIAIGFDKHPRGAFSVGDDLEGLGLGQWYGQTGLAVNPQFFAMKTRRYMHRKALDHDTISSSPMVCDPLRQYHFCSPSEGAAAMVICRAEVARRYTTRPILLRADVFRTRLHGSFETMSPSQPVTDVPGPTVQASALAYEQAGLGPQDVGVAQVQDTEAGHEIMHMAENGFCKDGEQEALVREGATAIDGRLPINTDGGLMANGEPIGASGLRQVYEVCLQLRGDAGARQVPSRPKTGYTQVYGFPGVSCVTILST
jgi:acetyl-CoA acetyltransferase